MEESEEKFIRVFVDGVGIPTRLSQEDFVSFLRSCGVTAYFAALEKGRSKRLHWQAYVRGSIGLESRLRRWLKDNAFRGNKMISIKDRDERGIVGLLSYLMKQGQFVHSGLEASIIDEATEMNAHYREVAKKKESTYTQLRNHLSTLYIPPSDEDRRWLVNEKRTDIQGHHYVVPIPVDGRRLVFDVVDWFASRPGLASAPMIEGYATTMACVFVNNFRHQLSQKIYLRIWGEHM